MAVPLDKPPFVVRSTKLVEREAQLLDRAEALHPQQLLLQRSNEPFGDSVPLRRAHEGRIRLDPEEVDLVLEVVGDVAAVVVAQLQAERDLMIVAPEVLPHSLAGRLERLEARGRSRRVDTDAFGVAVI